MEWYIRRAWAPLLFEDEGWREEWNRQDPILLAKPSESVKQKKTSHQTAEGLAVHSFETLTSELASRARVTYRLPREESKLTFKQVPKPTPLQAGAYELVGLLPVPGN